MELARVQELKKQLSGEQAKKLAPAQRRELWKKLNDEDTKRQAQAGIQAITFDAATAKQYYDKAYEVGWAAAIKASPQYGPQMKKLFSK